VLTTTLPGSVFVVEITSLNDPRINQSTTMSTNIHNCEISGFYSGEDDDALLDFGAV
jgi:hypothetical protein